MIGTSMCWGTIARETDPKQGLIAMPHVFNGENDLYVFGGAGTAGAAVTWFQDLLGGAISANWIPKPPQCRRARTGSCSCPI